MSRPPRKAAAPESPSPGMGNILDFHLDASKILALAADGNPETFSPLPLRNLAPEVQVPFNVYIKCKPKKLAEPEFILCCPQGEVFRRDWHRKLKNLKVPWIYFPLSEEALVLEFLHRNLREISPKVCRSDPEKAGLVLDAMLLWLQHFFLTETGRTGSKLAMALDFIDLMFAIVKGNNSFLSFMVEMKQHDEYLFKHSLNVCVIGLAFIGYLGLTDKEARPFGLGALLHDLGMIQVSRSILQKPGSLDPEEMRMIKRHPTHSYHMLKNLPGIPRETIAMVQQHHENGDGSGYPTGLVGSATHSWAKILRVLDSYESVTSGRPWRQAKSPKETLWDMRYEWEESQVYDPSILKAFIIFLGDGD